MCKENKKQRYNLPLLVKTLVPLTLLGIFYVYLMFLSNNAIVLKKEEKELNKVEHPMSEMQESVNNAVDNSAEMTKNEINTIKDTSKDRSTNTDEPATEPLIQPNVERFYVHIPKAAGYSAVTRFNKYAERYVDRKFRLCNEGIKNLIRNKNIKKHRYQWGATDKKGIHCQVHMAESEYNEDILRGRSGVYAILRDPREHVVSQYYHCTEAPIHRNKDHMPSTLTEWLADWMKGFNEIKESQNDPETRNEVTNEKWLKYYCYRPINMQSGRTGFDGSDEGLKRLGDKFDVMGVSHRFEEALCLIFIHASGGIVPKECNCSSSRRRLGATIRVSHGVTHHASDYELNDEEKYFIDGLTEHDKKQYDYVKDVLFDKQVEKFEKEYDFKLCENPKPNY